MAEADEDAANDKLTSHQSCVAEEVNKIDDEGKTKVFGTNADEDGDVSDISEEERDSVSSDPQKIRPKKKVKKKRRSKSFNSNDEETSSSDEDVHSIVANSKNRIGDISLKDLTWTMWLWYYVVAVSSGAFHFAEYLGEKLADFFGITSPKYQYVIDEYYRMKREEEEERKAVEKEEEFVQKKKLEKLSQLEVGADDLNPTEDPLQKL
ncbi:protein FAM177A1-like [Rhopilema esculentum]|uniref:protein FAM177A1-like n=1 Tax=Rhopilema esculentum TaxID=499914 RepID=UPI0031D50674|eukprot:gene3072-1357_t